MKLKTITKDDWYEDDYYAKYGDYLYGIHIDGSIIAYLDMTASSRKVQGFKYIFDNVGLVSLFETGAEAFIFSSCQLEDYLKENELVSLDKLENDDLETIKYKIKKVIYEYYPKFMTRTLMGYKYETDEERILNDCNIYEMTLMIGNEKFRVEKQKQKVKVLTKEHFKTPYIEFEIDNDIYLTSVKLYETRQSLERLLKKSYMNPFDNEELLKLTNKLINLQNELKNKTF